MPLSFETVREISDELRNALIDVWADATNAGGAVGFLAPVDRETVADHAVKTFAGVAEGLDHLVVGYEGERVAAWLIVADRRFALMDHMRLVKCVMVDPKSQGRGYGVELVREAERVARTLDGVEMLHLVCRGGLNLERFYAKCGYVEVGRIPRALRVGADDYRDEITMLLTL
jgi:GNAT superfamily N-acetyltransferase